MPRDEREILLPYRTKKSWGFKKKLYSIEIPLWGAYFFHTFKIKNFKKRQLLKVLWGTNVPNGNEKNKYFNCNIIFANIGQQNTKKDANKKSAIKATFYRKISL